MERREPPSKLICCQDMSGWLSLETPALVLPFLRFRRPRPGGGPSPVRVSQGANPGAAVSMTTLKGHRPAPGTPPPLWIEPQIQVTPAGTRPPG